MNPALILFAVAAVAALLTAEPVEREGPDAQGYTWERTGPTGVPYVHTGVDVYLNCGLEPGAESCARVAGGRCDVYLPDDPAPWQEPHERKHCAGWVHPGGLHW